MSQQQPPFDFTSQFDWPSTLEYIQAGDPTYGWGPIGNEVNQFEPSSVPSLGYNMVNSSQMTGSLDASNDASSTQSVEPLSGHQYNPLTGQFDLPQLVMPMNHQFNPDSLPIAETLPPPYDLSQESSLPDFEPVRPPLTIEEGRKLLPIKGESLHDWDVRTTKAGRYTRGKCGDEAVEAQIAVMEAAIQERVPHNDSWSEDEGRPVPRWTDEDEVLRRRRRRMPTTRVRTTTGSPSSSSLPAIRGATPTPSPAPESQSPPAPAVFFLSWKAVVTPSGKTKPFELESPIADPRATQTAMTPERLACWKAEGEALYEGDLPLKYVATSARVTYSRQPADEQATLGFRDGKAIDEVMALVTRIIEKGKEPKVSLVSQYTAKEPLPGDKAKGTTTTKQLAAMEEDIYIQRKTRNWGVDIQTKWACSLNSCSNRNSTCCYTKAGKNRTWYQNHIHIDGKAMARWSKDIAKGITTLEKPDDDHLWALGRQAGATEKRKLPEAVNERAPGQVALDEVKRVKVETPKTPSPSPVQQLHVPPGFQPQYWSPYAMPQPQMNPQMAAMMNAMPGFSYSPPNMSPYATPTLTPSQFAQLPVSQFQMAPPQQFQLHHPPPPLPVPIERQLSPVRGSSPIEGCARAEGLRRYFSWFKRLHAEEEEGDELDDICEMLVKKQWSLESLREPSKGGAQRLEDMWESRYDFAEGHLDSLRSKLREFKRIEKVAYREWKAAGTTESASDVKGGVEKIGSIVIDDSSDDEL